MTDCLFCKILKGDIPADIVYEDAAVVAFRDIDPQAPTHILVVPRQHIPTINDLTSKQGSVVGQMYLAAQAVARDEGVSESGYRTVFNCNRDGGQDIYHLHLHLLGGRPMRWPPG